MNAERWLAAGGERFGEAWNGLVRYVLAVLAGLGMARLGTSGRGSLGPQVARGGAA